MNGHEVPQILAHFYRAAVARADVWRQRLDATTNWAVVATIAVLAFALGDPGAPHFVLLMVIAFDLLFLAMESRRYQIYHLWELRVHALHHYLIAPALDPANEAQTAEARRTLHRLAEDLGSTLPRINFFQAAAFRIRRNYGPLVTICLLAWLLKLWLSPTPAQSVEELIARATVGLVPGPLVVALVLLFFLTLVAAALLAPSEHIEAWAHVGSPLHRLLRRGSGPTTRRSGASSPPDDRNALET